MSTSHSHQSSSKGLQNKISFAPPFLPRTHSPTLLVVEAREEVDRREGEEQQHRVEEDEPTDNEPRDICATE